MKKVICLLSLIIAVSVNRQAEAFEVNVHERISIKAIDYDTANLNTALTAIGLHGLGDEINGKIVRRWIEDGSKQEDEPLLAFRYFKHFYNPLTGEGLKGIFMPSYDWASDDGNEWSWKVARSRYYEGLTKTTDTERKSALADSFRSIGQVMHLVQDLASVAHTRNDAHGIYDGFEYYTKENIGSLNYSAATISIPTTSVTSYAPRQFWDSDTYDGSNPSGSSAIGLSEYTNANFFSGDTIFSSSFPYPAWSSVEEYEGVDTTTGDSITYLRKLGDGEAIEHLAAGRWYYKFLPTSYKMTGWGLKLDDNCYNDYASLLLPRAVGYSAGLLNYFFRGDIDLQEDTNSGSGYVIVNNTEEDMEGTFEIYYDKISYDRAGNRSDERAPLWSSATPSDSLFIGKKDSENPDNNKSQNISFSKPTDAAEPGKYILVFSGRLGSEQNAIVGKVVSYPNLYILVMPVNHETREIEAKQYYSMKVTDSNNSTVTLTETTETSIPFTLLDDGAYWDTVSLSWTATTNPESLGAPLGNGGPQYFAKYHDTANNRIRFVPNLTYEKEAYTAFDASYSGIKEMHYVNYIGSPLFGFGMYNANTGWMEYTDSGLYTILSPAGEPKQRLFSLYKANNFNDTFIETPYLKFYDFNGRNNYETAIPKDPEAPMTSIVSAYIPAGENYIKLTVPKVYNTYIKPNPYWKNSTSTASSGVDIYRLSPNTEPTYETDSYKCTSEDNNCGNTGTNGSSVKTVFDIPYNFNSYIRVHRNDGGKYYEEIYINGNLIQSSTPSIKLDTHYQVLAVYNDIALIRETNYVSSGEIQLSYRLESNRIYEKNWSFSSKYYIYVKGKRYDLQGITNIKTKYLNVPYFETVSGVPLVDYLTYEPVDDITGYHIDRIAISDTFDGSYVLVAFDEYAYNNGEGLVHDLRYEPSDSDATKHILYYDIPKTEIQNADHEAIRTGRKLLLFKGDGTFKQELQDPIGLDKTIGSIGILN